jgi:hypothetical protein
MPNSLYLLISILFIPTLISEVPTFGDGVKFYFVECCKYLACVEKLQDTFLVNDNDTNRNYNGADLKCSKMFVSWKLVNIPTTTPRYSLSCRTFNQNFIIISRYCPCETLPVSCFGNRVSFSSLQPNVTFSRGEKIETMNKFKKFLSSTWDTWLGSIFLSGLIYI